METSFLFLDVLAAIMPEPVEKTCDFLSQLVLLSLTGNMKGAFWKLDFILFFLHKGKNSYFEAQQIPWLHPPPR